MTGQPHDTSAAEHERMRETVGVLVLGVIDPEDRPGVEAHVAACPDCAALVADLAVLPGLLHRVDPAQAGAGLPEPSEELAGRVLAAGRELVRNREREQVHRRRLALLSAAAALVLGALLGGALLTRLGSGAQAPVTVVSATDPTTAVRAQVRLVSQATGTELTVALSGVAPGQRCSLVAVGTGGEREVAATWVATYQGRASVTGSTSLPRSSLSQVQVVAADGSPLVSLPVPPDARG